LDPDKVTLPDFFMGLYGLAYDFKQGIYKPIKNAFAPQPQYVLDANQNVVESGIRQDHSDALVALGQVAGLLLPETRMGLGPEVPTAYIQYGGKLATVPSDFNFLRLNAEWAQVEGNLIRGERAAIDPALRRLARAEIDQLGIDRTELQAMHPLDSAAAGRFITPDTELGSTYYFGNKSVNMAFGSQLGNELSRLGVRVGQEFRLEFVDPPSYNLVPPMAPPASSPNLYTGH
jgi:hypothetical protein